MDIALDPSDVNTVAKFLAFEQVPHLKDAKPVDCIVLCVSAIFHCADTVFSALQARHALAQTLVLCGGIGHSTPFLYETVAMHPVYADLHSEIEGLPEAGVIQKIFERHYDAAAIRKAGCTVLIEDQSTNCGANAMETRKLLTARGMEMPRTFIVVQDPTMARRTIASFEKAYSDLESPPAFLSCPAFVPAVQIGSQGLAYSVPGIQHSALWAIPRFLDLIAGEIPRLRDDDLGYGPKGKGFIVHVDIPEDVEEAWKRIINMISRCR
ncbi:hypothetical protein MMC08_003439 [Hypocenomyce scalaris]|nr:hypothetical protein [Hypocenomyce scalaris]